MASPKRNAKWNGIGTQILFDFEERRWIYNPFFRKYLERERNTLKKDFLKDWSGAIIKTLNSIPELPIQLQEIGK